MAIWFAIPAALIAGKIIHSAMKSSGSSISSTTGTSARDETECLRNAEADTILRNTCAALGLYLEQHGITATSSIETPSAPFQQRQKTLKSALRKLLNTSTPTDKESRDRLISYCLEQYEKTNDIQSISKQIGLLEKKITRAEAAREALCKIVGNKPHQHS